MARSAGAHGLPCRNNSKLDSFLKRNTSRDVYERIRAYEPCVVVSGSVKRVFMHVILTDERVYLTEYNPRALRDALRFRDVASIELINDLPDFLSGRDRERSLHIRVVHTARQAGKKSPKPRGTSQNQDSPIASPLQAHNLTTTRRSLEEISRVFLSSPSAQSDNRISPTSLSSDRGLQEDETTYLTKTRSVSCPNRDVLGLGVFQPLSPVHVSSSTKQQRWAAVTCRRGLSLARLLRRTLSEKDKEEEEDEKEEELHLYAVSPTSRIYLHLQSAWSSYIMRSTLMLDPVYQEKCNPASCYPEKLRRHKISWERTCHLFSQLSGEMFHDNISLENLYLLLQELHTATYRNPGIRKLFWRSSDLYPFLVKTLADGSQTSQEGIHTIDRLLLCTEVVQILSLMFRETEIEPARLGMLTAKQGTVTASMLLALVCDPEVQPQLQGLQTEYLDAASALLFEVVVLCQEASRTHTLGNFLTVGWVFRILTPHPFLLPFVGYQAQQVVLILSGEQNQVGPSEAVLLYQRCRVLIACLQHSAYLRKYIKTTFKEEFRYYVKVSELKHKLPQRYPISPPTQLLLSQLLQLVLHKP